MKSAINNTLSRYFPNWALRRTAYKKLVTNRKSFLYSSGWMQSIAEGKPIGLDGQPTPWMNYSVVKLLEERLQPQLTIFEYGSGYSTLYYARKVSQVISVEYDQQWYDIIHTNVPANARIILQDKDVDGDYCRQIQRQDIDQFDVVVVDGRDRVNCVKQCLPHLSAQGVILLDDSQRTRYEDAFTFAKEHGFKALSLEGMKATGAGIYRTTIFYRDGNCLGL